MPLEKLSGQVKPKKTLPEPHLRKKRQQKANDISVANSRPWFSSFKGFELGVRKMPRCSSCPASEGPQEQMELFLICYKHLTTLEVESLEHKSCRVCCNACHTLSHSVWDCFRSNLSSRSQIFHTGQPSPRACDYAGQADVKEQQSKEYAPWLWHLAMPNYKTTTPKWYTTKRKMFFAWGKKCVRASKKSKHCSQPETSCLVIHWHAARIAFKHRPKLKCHGERWREIASPKASPKNLKSFCQGLWTWSWCASNEANESQVHDIEELGLRGVRDDPW